MRVRRYAFVAATGMFIACSNGCGEDGRMEIMESQDGKGAYDDVEMKCTNCGHESLFAQHTVFLSLEFTGEK